MAQQDLIDDLLTLARLALSGRQQDVFAFLQKTARRYRQSEPRVTSRLTELLRESPSRASPLRRQNGAPVPVDLDSRLQLLRVEQPATLDVEPILNPQIQTALTQIVLEQRRLEELMQAGLAPSRAILFVGPPGVGKTLSGRWIASELNRPLLVLDLSAVMSSFLGRTGGNVRAVIDYAKNEECVLFLDEFDAVAKRRDDSSEIGELKRLVTVLLQEIDDWPSGSLLLAATNHPDLLDPAIWRRFDITLDFPQPTETELTKAIELFLGNDLHEGRNWVPILSVLFRGRSFNDVERSLLRARRRKVINDTAVSDELQSMVHSLCDGLGREERLALAKMLQAHARLSERRASDLAGANRGTLRKRQQSGTGAGKRRPQTDA